MAAKNGHIYEFGDFRLIPGEGLLLHDGEPVALTNKAFSTLVLLVERHGHLVPRSELIETVWENAFVEESAVSRSVWSIRQALGEDSKTGRFIQTIQRRGYRFVSPVMVVNDGSGAFRLSDLPEIEEATADVMAGHEMPTANGNAGEILIEAVGTEAMATVPSHQVSSASRSNRRRILMWAVYGGIGAVLLVGIASFGFTNWRHLGKDNNPPDRGTKNEEAYQLYQQAENLSSRRYPKSVLNALDSLNQAVTLDPDFARAWAAKAHVHRYIAEYLGADQTEQYKQSMDALGKAIAIDPNLSEAYSALCLNKLRYEYDVAGAEGACKRALELDPDSSVGHRVYATFLYSRGRSDESIAEIKRGIDRQPLSNELQQTYALALYYARRYEEEEAQWKRLIELHPTHGYIYTRLFMNAAQQGKEDKAFDYLIKKLTLDKADNETLERFRVAYAASGWRGVTMERIKRPETESFTGPFDVACLYATLGDKDRAFENLENAYQERTYRLAVLQVEPQLDPLRDDPRFADLIRRVDGK